MRVRQLDFRWVGPSSMILLAAALAAGSLGCKQKGFTLPPPEVTVTQVLQEDTPVYVEFVGQTRGYEDIDIRARVDGFVESVNFKEGSEVRKGDLLYTIDAREYQERVAQARGQLARARTMLTDAEIEVRRITPLVAISAVSQRDLDNAVARQGSAKGEVDAMTAQVAISELNLSYTRVTAPISGIIGKTQAKVGDYVGRPPNVMILNTVSDVDPILVEFFLSESEYLWAVKTFGEKAAQSPTKGGLEMVLADGSVFPHEGVVNFADREVDSETGTILVQASFPNPDKVLRPGQFARVRLLADTRKGAILVPQRAVEELQGSYQVWVVGKENKAQIRPVRTGPKVGSLWVVEQGLDAGDRVILEGLTKVKPDMVVVPKEAPQPAGPSPAAGQGG